jgi:dihydroorotate dehydrogenase
VLLKIAPDLTDAQVVEVVGIAREEGIAGLIATNTTVSREGLRTPRAEVEALGDGGISGRPVRRRALEVVGLIWRETRGELPVVGVGGIFDARDAWERIRAGASLVQLYTGFVYGGPTVVRGVNRGLLRLLRREGFRSLEEAVGSAHAGSGGAA